MSAVKRRWSPIAAGLSLILVLLGTGCAPNASLAPVLPVDSSPQATWTFAAQLLGRGDAAGALTYLDTLDADSLTTGRQRALFLRDLAEARLVSGDLPGAALAADNASTELARQPVTPQFRDDDRYVFQRTLDALAAAGHDDAATVRRLATDDARAPSADAWYLLGWLAERHGDSATARASFSTFLTLAPRWAFLRQSLQMRRHAVLSTQQPS